MTFNQYLHALESQKFHGYNIALHILSRMLKLTIGVWTGRYVWLSSPNINVFEVSVLLTVDQEGRFDATGNKKIKKTDLSVLMYAPSVGTHFIDVLWRLLVTHTPNSDWQIVLGL